jgi:hypothetical protein
MNSMVLIGYLFPMAVCMTAIWDAISSMKNDVKLVARGNIGSALVVACGFCVFPVLNVPAGLWLLYELSQAEKTAADNGQKEGK